MNKQPLSIGTTVPPVTALTQDSELIDFQTIFSRGTTLVYFYPKANTPGCTAEACSLRDAYETLRDKEGNGIEILGVSKDTPAAQKKFQQKYQLPFPLIADYDGVVAKAFAVTTIPLTGITKRQSFLVKNGIIVWSSLAAKTSGAAEEVQNALDNLD
ncbi:MAG: peroxiredoxin [Chthoniobacterales bacterium]